ncbi:MULTISPECIES: hypothetical protein [Yersinia]|uniref:hypothetical protein n=1 Tax=Yersinia TaxID=629 RepID=UPI0018693CF8|nr:MULTISPECIES: hypothetical protein [Yersinia]
MNKLTKQELQIKMAINDKWHLVKLTQIWPDGHLINQLAHALIESNAELAAMKETKPNENAEPKQKKLIGWRMEDFTHETTDIEVARNWAPNVGVLPIFEGDINTSISTITIDTTPL